MSFKHQKNRSLDSPSNQYFSIFFQRTLMLKIYLKQRQTYSTIGPIVRINVPKFIFEEAQQEERNVESFLDNQQGNQNYQQEYQNDLYNPTNQDQEGDQYDNTNRTLTNNSKDDRTLNRINNNSNLPIIQNGRRASSSQRPRSQPYQIPLSNNQSFRYDSSNGQKNMNASFSMNNGNIRQIKQIGYNNEEDSKILQPQRNHSKSFADQSQYNNNQSRILNGSFANQENVGNSSKQQEMNNSHLSWISSLARKEQARIVRMPARNPQRISLTMNQQQKIQSHILDVSSIMNESSLLNKSNNGGKPKSGALKSGNLLDESTIKGGKQGDQSILNKTGNIGKSLINSSLEKSQILRQTSKDQRLNKQVVLIESSKAAAQQIKEQKQLKGNQKAYDKWDSERSPEEWLKLYKNQSGSHGMCTVNLNNKQNLTFLNYY